MKKHKPAKLDVSVVGLEYRVTGTTLQKMSDVLPLKCYLVREPTNIHDEYAIRVVVHPDSSDYGNFHIGYLRRIVAELLAPVMDEGKLIVLECRLTEIDVDAGEGEMALLVSSETDLKLKT